MKILRDYIESSLMIWRNWRHKKRAKEVTIKHQKKSNTCKRVIIHILLILLMMANDKEEKNMLSHVMSGAGK